MKRSLEEYLADYAAYHRDRRNIATHFFGIPVVVLSICTLLGKPLMMVGGVALTPAAILCGFATLFYCRLSLRFGLAMALFLGAHVSLGFWLADLAPWSWLTLGGSLFAVGWFIQFMGHYFEQRKPAFMDDLIGLLIGPLFIVAEAAFFIGLAGPTREAIIARVGPALIRA